MEKLQKFDNLQDLLEEVQETFNTEKYQLVPYAGRYRKERRFNVCVNDAKILVETQADGSLLILNVFDPFIVDQTLAGSSTDYTDVILSSGRILRDVPFFNYDGHVISYDEALKLYGFDGLSDGIWNDPEYIKHIKNNI